MPSPQTRAGPADAEKPLLAADLACALADRAGHGFRAGLRAGPLAIRTALPARDPDLGRSAEGCILKTDPEIVSKVVPGSCPGPGSAAAEEFTENISKDVAHAHAGAESARSGALRSRYDAVLIVIGPFLGIGQDLIGRAHFFKGFFSCLVTRVLVRMILMRQPPVRALNLRIRCIPVHAEQFVKILCHNIL